MGIGPLGAPGVKFVRKFRWILESTGLPEHLVSDVKIQFHKKMIIANCYEVMETQHEEDIGKIRIQDWVEDPYLKDKTLVLTTYDGCGDPIYQYKFKKIELKEDNMDLSYSSSDCSMRELHIHFGTYTREVFQPERHVNPREDANENV